MSKKQTLSCKSCNNEIDVISQSCPECNSSEPFDMLFCKHNDCGKSYPKGLPHCIHCGKSNASQFATLIILVIAAGFGFMIYSLINFMGN